MMTNCTSTSNLLKSLRLIPAGKQLSIVKSVGTSVFTETHLAPLPPPHPPPANLLIFTTINYTEREGEGESIFTIKFKSKQTDGTR
jgi:hypothetical protein